ncbi:M28 family peptidase [Calditrichota bacterium]
MSIKNTLIVLLTLTIITTALFAFEPGTPQRLRVDVEYLCSSQLAGRNSPGPEADQTAEWIASRFRILGMTSPYIEDDFYQSVPLRTGVIDTVVTSVILNGDGWELLLTWGKDFYLFPGSLHPIDTTFSLVYAGFAMLVEHLGDSVNIENIFPRHQSGKATLFEIGGGDISNEAAGRFGMTPFKAAAATRAGASMSIAMASADMDWPPPETSQKLSNLPKGLVDFPDVQSKIPVVYLNSASLTEHLDQVKNTRRANSPNVNISLHLRFRDVKEQSSKNVIAKIDGTSYNYVMLGAHYDHEGMVASTPEDTTLVYYPGADDNASGVAAMLEICRLWSKREQPVTGLIAVAFTAEEDGLLGSKWLSDNLPIVPENLVAMINLDMIGRAAFPSMRDVHRPGAVPDSSYLAMYYAAASPALEPLLTLATAGSPLKVNLQAVNSFAHFGDVASLYAIEVPTVHLFTGFHADYSQLTDTPDKIDFVKLARVVDLIDASLQSIADSHQPITFDPNVRVKGSHMPY